MKRILLLVVFFGLSAVPFVAVKHFGSLFWDEVLGCVSHDCTDKVGYSRVGPDSAQIVFPEDKRSPPLSPSAYGLIYPPDRIRYLLSGEGTYAGSSDLRPRSNFFTLSTLVYEDTGHDVRQHLASASANHISGPILIDLPAKPQSGFWRRTEMTIDLAGAAIPVQQVLEKNSTRPTIIIFPAKLVPGQVPFLAEFPDLNYVYIPDYRAELSVVYFDNCKALMADSMREKSRYISEFLLRADQKDRLVDIYRWVTSGMCEGPTT